MEIVLDAFCSESAIALDGSGTTAGMAHQPGMLLAELPLDNKAYHLLRC